MKQPGIPENKHSASPQERGSPLLHVLPLHYHQSRSQDYPHGPGPAHEVAEEELADDEALVESSQGVDRRQGVNLTGALNGTIWDVSSARILHTEQGKKGLPWLRDSHMATQPGNGPFGGL